MAKYLLEFLQFESDGRRIVATIAQWENVIPKSGGLRKMKNFFRMPQLFFWGGQRVEICAVGLLIEEAALSEHLVHLLAEANGDF
ncbi:MAG: hypothetical protein RLZZ245_1104 [Verrucomicrobiota bacterium]